MTLTLRRAEAVGFLLPPGEAGIASAAPIGRPTHSPQAFWLSACPAASIRSPSALMLRAAFRARSTEAPHDGQAHILSASVSPSC